MLYIKTTTGFSQLRQLRIEHDLINSLRIGSLSPWQKARLADLRQQLSGTAFGPWEPGQTKEAYESIYGPGSWEGS